MNSKIKKIIISFFSLFKVKNIILLESFPYFSDSSKVFFDYLIKNKINDHYKIYWLVENKDLFKDFNYKNVFFIEVMGNSFINKLRMLHYSKKAKYIFICNRHITKYNKKTKYIYFTHGIPLKYIKNIKMLTSDVDYIISPGKYWDNIFSDQFNIDKDKILPLGQPRYDIVFKHGKENNFDFIDKKYNKILLWLPTFRQHKDKVRKDIKKEFPFGLPLLYDKNDIKELNDYLINKDMLLIMKLHPRQDTSVLKELNSKNIIFINDDDLFRNKAILTDLIHKSDIIMTDYSSVFYEGMAMNKRVIYSIDDFADYKSNRGFLCDNPEFYMVGDKVKNTEELLKAFDNSFKEDIYKKEKEERVKLFFDYHDNLASKRICDYFKIK